MIPPFRANNTNFAYQLHYHLGFRTRRCVPIFRDAERQQVLRDAIDEVCEFKNYHLLEIDVDDCWIRLLLSLRPAHSPSTVVQSLKTNSSREIFAMFPETETEMTGRSLWSRGYYVRGVGDVTQETVRRYVAKQRTHHRDDARLLAEYHHPDPREFFEFRPFDHCVGEYNCHIVCSPLDHVPAIDAECGRPLLEYVLDVAVKKEFDVISLAILEDHIHLFAALRPSQSPDYVALALMNNSAYWFSQRNPGAMKLWDAPGLWSPGAFVRTAGSVTTNIVRSHIRNRELLVDE